MRVGKDCPRLGPRWPGDAATLTIVRSKAFTRTHGDKIAILERATSTARRNGQPRRPGRGRRSTASATEQQGRRQAGQRKRSTTPEAMARRREAEERVQAYGQRRQRCAPLGLPYTLGMRCGSPTLRRQRRPLGPMQRSRCTASTDIRTGTCHPRGGGSVGCARGRA